MKYISILIVIITTSLINFHSFNAWYAMTDNVIISLAWGLVIDGLAVYFWFDGAKKKAIIASVFVVSAAFFHLSTNVVLEIDQGFKTKDNLAFSKDQSLALAEIGKGASKYGNHVATDKAIELLQVTSKNVSTNQDEAKGTLQLWKLIIATVIQMAGIMIAISGQIYAVNKLRAETQNNKKETEKEKVTVIRNIIVDSQVKDFAINLWKDLQAYMKANDITSGNKMMALLGENQGVATRLKQTKETGKGIALEKLQELQSKLKAL